MSANRMFDLLGLDQISAPAPIDEVLRLPRITPEERALPTIPAATPEDQLAREIVAQIEREDGYEGCAFSRLRGAYDGDGEHRIAVAAIRAAQSLREKQSRDGSVSNKPLPVNK